MSSALDSTPSTSRLEVLRKLGRGGMADVYLCRMGGVGGFEKKLVAKVVRPEHAQDQVFARMFMDEARLSARLQHPNLIHVYGIEHAEGRLVLMMEYVEGPSLNDLLRRAYSQSDVPPMHVAALLAGVARGLAYAHRLTGADGASLKLIHRDVSLDNVLVSLEGTPKLIDFGIARAADRVGQTQVGTVKGKLQYMAPEQLDGQDVDHRADIYALGVCLYIALSGAKPYPAATQREVWRLRMIGDVVPLGERRPDLPLELVELVEHAMELDPNERIDSADLLADRLEALSLSGAEPSRRRARVDWITRYASSDDEPVDQHLVPITQSLSVVLRGSFPMPAQTIVAPSGSLGVLTEASAAVPTTRSGDVGVPRWRVEGQVAVASALALLAMAGVWMVRGRSESETPEVEPLAPVAVQSVAVDPASLQPAAVEPVAVEPAAVEPAAVEPAAVEPAAVDPAVVKPAAVEPSAVDPAAVGPAAGEPAAIADAVSPDAAVPAAEQRVAPAQITPVEVAPVKAAPVETAPVETAPVETAPVRVSESLPVDMIIRSGSDIGVAFDAVAAAVVSDGGDKTLATKACRAGRDQILRDFFPGSTITLYPRALARFLLASSESGAGSGPVLSDVRRGLRDGRYGETQ